MYKFLNCYEWLSIENAIEPLGAILEGQCKCREDVLDSVLKGGLQASVYIESPQILVYPMVRLAGDEAVEFKRDEQQIHTSRGPSFQIDNNFLAPNRVFTLLPRGAILDLPIKPASDYLYRLRYHPSPHGKRLVLPGGTLLKVPGTDDYFMSIDILDAPDVFCEIVIRTQAIQEFQRQQIELREAQAKDTATPAPVVDVVPARPDPERRLALLRELGGAAKYTRCEWKFTGIKALVDSEKANGRKRSTEKTIRADLKEAAHNERDESRAGFHDGLGQR